ncbi:MAG: undecaprenyldiphospho-muramoylpentapeptide beta-N-acetylglucosaminyltransferase [Rickettsiales bacterium]|jgi:undecaprenyldiphospho-muramoylpentapeptide beta-N-acetylglucosaminyltransferase
MTKTIILATGGTGGHIFPAQAIAKELGKQGFKIVVFGDKNYRKYHKAESLFGCQIISSSTIIMSPFNLIKAGFKISIGILQSLFFILKYRPETVVAFGGYATFPTLISAIILRKEIILHEQNAHLGKVNRIFAKFATKIALSYHKTDGIKVELESKTIFVGNPIRQEIAALGELEYQLPVPKPEAKIVDNLGYDVLLASQFDKKKSSFIPSFDYKKRSEKILMEIENFSSNYDLGEDYDNDLDEGLSPHNLAGESKSFLENWEFSPNLIKKDADDNRFNILVIGGSGGAKIFSEILPRAFFNLRDELKNNLLITQQCRENLAPKTFEQYKSLGISVRVSGFFENMAEEISKSHLIISRSGSSSIAEFTAAKKPMILIPFALSADNHQEKNAFAAEKSGAAIVIKEQDFTISKVTTTLEKLIDNPSILQKMSAHSFEFANMEAANNLTKLAAKC